MSPTAAKKPPAQLIGFTRPAATVTPMTTDHHAPIAVFPAGDQSDWEHLLDGPDATQPYIVHVSSTADVPVPDNSYMEAFPSAETTKVVHGCTFIASQSALWVPKVAYKMLQEHVTAVHENDGSWSWIAGEPVDLEKGTAILATLAPQEACRRVLRVEQLGTANQSPILVAAAMTEAAQLGGIDFDKALDLVDLKTFQRSDCIALLGVATAA